jgi:hypothetical protein
VDDTWCITVNSRVTGMTNVPTHRWHDDLFSTRNLVIAFALLEAIGIIAVLTVV